MAAGRPEQALGAACGDDHIGSVSGRRPHQSRECRLPASADWRSARTSQLERSSGAAIAALRDMSATPLSCLSAAGNYHAIRPLVSWNEGAAKRPAQ